MLKPNVFDCLPSSCTVLAAVGYYRAVLIKKRFQNVIKLTRDLTYVHVVSAARRKTPKYTEYFTTMLISFTQSQTD